MELKSSTKFKSSSEAEAEKKKKKGSATGTKLAASSSLGGGKIAGVMAAEKVGDGKVGQADRIDGHMSQGQFNYIEGERKGGNRFLSIKKGRMANVLGGSMKKDDSNLRRSKLLGR
tara:strand:+ start:75 stop:422 length:348 start_codon:yes stop_codon:yes gene_type:complete